MKAAIRLGVIGLGNMGSTHCRLLERIPSLELTAVADIITSRAEKVATQYNCHGFSDAYQLLDARVCDAVLIATPHYDHTPIGIAALKSGYHVLVEKPISVHKADCEKLIAAHTRRKQIFAAMFNQRTNRYYQTIKEMLTSGELGKVRRVSWTITDWFRAQSYYDSGGWRATWAGEGGGVLLNQCPHQLDLLQWLFGMPDKVTAFCHISKHHKIEVEDEVTAYLQYKNGATGVFSTSTGEAPGINRLEIAAENGLLTYDTAEGVIHFSRNTRSVSDAIKLNQPFQKPETRQHEIRLKDTGEQHREILINFADAINGKSTLIAPAKEGIRSVELANAMLLSAFRNKTVELPLDPAAYQRHLKKLIRSSSYNPNLVTGGDITDLSNSF